jgi:hypothetical protein
MGKIVCRTKHMWTYPAAELSDERSWLGSDSVDTLLTLNSISENALVTKYYSSNQMFMLVFLC